MFQATVEANKLFQNVGSTATQLLIPEDTVLPKAQEPISVVSLEHASYRA